MTNTSSEILQRKLLYWILLAFLTKEQIFLQNLYLSHYVNILSNIQRSCDIDDEDEEKIRQYSIKRNINAIYNVTRIIRYDRNLHTENKVFIFNNVYLFYSKLQNDKTNNDASFYSVELTQKYDLHNKAYLCWINIYFIFNKYESVLMYGSTF